MSRMTGKFHCFFWVIVCVIGNIVQLYWISSQYFRYDIATNVQLLIPDRIDLPVVTMCFDLIRVIKWSAMTEEERNTILQISDEEYIYSQLTEKKENITIRDIEEAVHSNVEILDQTMLVNRLQATFNTSRFFQVIFRGIDILSATALFNPIKKNVDGVMDDNLFEVRPFMRDNHVCYLFDIKNRSWIAGLSYSAIRKQSILSKNTVGRYWFHEETVWMLSDAIYILSAIGHSSRLDTNAFLRLPMDTKTSFSLTYNEYRSTLLPPPYATMCRNYAKEGFISKDGCYESCLRQLSLEKMKRLHPSLPISPNETGKMTSFMNLYADKFANKIDLPQEIDNVCTEECSRRDCSTVLYAPRYLLSQRRGERSTVTQYIALTPIIKADCLEQISLIQFLTDIASSLGFWLGMSAIGIARFIVYFFGGSRSLDYMKGHKLFSGWGRTRERRRKYWASHYDHVKLRRKVCEHDKWLKMMYQSLEENVMIK